MSSEIRGKIAQPPQRPPLALHTTQTVRLVVIDEHSMEYVELRATVLKRSPIKKTRNLAMRLKALALMLSTAGQIVTWGSIPQAKSTSCEDANTEE